MAAGFWKPGQARQEDSSTTRMKYPSKENPSEAWRTQWEQAHATCAPWVQSWNSFRCLP